MEQMVNVFVMGKKYEVPASLTIMKALEYAGYKLVRAKFAVHPDLLAHLLLFFLAVKKITEARTDQNIHLNRNIALHLPEQCRRRCCSTDDKMRTQFQPVRAAKPRRPAGSVRIHTSFN